MKRREWLSAALASTAHLALAPSAPAQAAESEAQAAESEAQATESEAQYRQRARASFPFELTKTSGEKALAIWQQRQAAAKGAAVVLGSEEQFSQLAEQLLRATALKQRTSAEILAAASRLRHPAELNSRRMAAKQRKSAQPDSAPPLPSISIQDDKGRDVSLRLRRFYEAELGDWPSTPPPERGLSVALGKSGKPLPSVQIATIPTDDWTTIPAHLHWGGWNDCPDPEYHVAALRSWRERYGAELVGFSFDTINLRVARSPATRQEALDLAREQYAYCNDIVDQGVETLSALAAGLMSHRWWYFWWA